MNILIVHKGFPGQFKHLIPHLYSRGDNLAFINPSGNKIHLPKDISIAHYPYTLSRGNGTGVHPLALETETKVLRGEAVGNVANTLLKKGYIPDLIIAHPGWGEALFLKEIWPKTPQLHYVEFAYKKKGTDSDFPDRYAPKQIWTENARVLMKNANVLLNLESMTWGITPTEFQYSTLPTWAHSKTSIIHDGIDTAWASPKEKVQINIGSNLKLTEKDEIISFVNRTFEPYRGIHIFLEAISEVLKKRPSAHILLIGQDTPNVSYGRRREDGQGWLTALKKQLSSKIDWSRIHCLGKIPHIELINIFRITSAHVYLTYPFVLSWSMLEAMSCGALVIGSETAPVLEVIQHGKNGLIVPFADSNKLAKQLIQILNQPEDFTAMRFAARETIESNYKLEKCINEQIKIIDKVATTTI